MLHWRVLLLWNYFWNDLEIWNLLYVVFGNNSTSKAVNLHSAAPRTTTSCLTHSNTTANHVITYTNTIASIVTIYKKCSTILKYCTYWPISLLFGSKVSRTCNTNLIGQCEVPVCSCYRNSAGTHLFIFQIWVEQKAKLSFSHYNVGSCMLKQHCTVNRTVELSSKGASEVMLTLKSIASSKTTQKNNNTWKCEGLLSISLVI